MNILMSLKTLFLVCSLLLTAKLLEICFTVGDHYYTNTGREMYRKLYKLETSITSAQWLHVSSLNSYFSGSLFLKYNGYFK